MATLDLAQVGPEIFEPHVGSTFLVVDGDQRIELVLAAVEALATPPHAHRPFFAMRFRASDGVTTLPQRIYRLEHGALGSLEIFLVPAAKGLHDAVFT